MTEVLIDLSTHNEKQIDKAWQPAAGVRKRKEQSLDGHLPKKWQTKIFRGIPNKNRQLFLEPLFPP